MACARRGEILIFVDGEPDVFARCEPVLTCLGTNLWRAGPLGTGQDVRALSNLLSATGLLAKGMGQTGAVRWPEESTGTRLESRAP